jgi:hypothetical protein
MKSTKIDYVTNNDQHVRLKIFDGDIKPDEYHQEMLSIEQHQHRCTMTNLREAQQRLAAVAHVLESVPAGDVRDQLLLALNGKTEV